MNTHWSHPYTNIFAAMNSLRKCLASGHNARLNKEWNEKCSFPLVEKIKDHRNHPDSWETSSATLQTLDQIQNNTGISDQEKHMRINYCQVFGTDVAIKNYRETGIITPDNVKGVGRAHIVKRQDVIEFLIKNGELERAKCFDLSDGNAHFVSHFHLKPAHRRVLRKFNKKLWVVEMLDKKEPKSKVPLMVHIIRVLVYPAKWIPSKSTLKMDEYSLYKFRIGSVTNGFSIEFHIPKKFSFN